MSNKPDGSVESRLRGRLRADSRLLSIGFGNTVVADRVVAIVTPNSSPMKRLKDDARDAHRLVDATHGRRTRAIVVTDSNHLFLSAIQAETLSQRYAAIFEADRRGAS